MSYFTGCMNFTRSGLPPGVCGPDGTCVGSSAKPNALGLAAQPPVRSCDPRAYAAAKAGKMFPDEGAQMRLILVMGLVLGLALAGNATSRAERLRSTVVSPSWTIDHSPAMPSALTERRGAQFFDFPSAPGSVNYVTQRTPDVTLAQIITMRFKLEGKGKLMATEGRSPAKVRLFMQRAGDTLTTREPYKRWWSMASVALVSPGTYILSAKIEPSKWSSVFGVVGTAAPTEFADCVGHLAHLGFTFGGDFAGHGVLVTEGAVRFVLQDYRVLSRQTGNHEQWHGLDPAQGPT